MSTRNETLWKLTDLPRNRPNITKVTNAIDGLEDLRNTLEPWLDAAEEIEQHVETFVEKTDEIDPDYMRDGAHDKLTALVRQLSGFLPHQDSELRQFVENYDAAKEGLDELESMYEDLTSYTGDDREEKWYEILELLRQMIDGMDQLESLDAPAEPVDEEDEEAADVLASA